jgi:Methylenetetrahydrofolate reductase
VIDLIDHGVEDLHLYTMNRADLVFAICHLIGLRAKPKVAAGTPAIVEGARLAHPGRRDAAPPYGGGDVRRRRRYSPRSGYAGRAIGGNSGALS